MKSRYPKAVDPSTSPAGLAGPAARFYAAYFAVLGVFMPSAGPYLEMRQLSAVGIGCGIAAFSLAKVAYAPLVGRLADRGRWRRGVLQAHGWTAAAAALGLPLAHGPWALGAVMVIVGLGYGTILPLIEASVLATNASGYGRYRVWGSAGFIAVAVGSGPVLGGSGIEVFPYALAASLAVMAITAAPFEEIVRPTIPTTSHAIPKDTWWLLTILAVHQIAHGPYYAFFSIRLADSGYSSVWIGVLWSVGVLAEVAAFQWGGMWEGRLSLKRTLGLVFILTPLRWGLLCLDPRLGVVVTAQIGHGVTFGMAHLAGIQLVQRSVPEGAARFAQALYSGLAFGLGIVVGSALAGPFYAISPATAFGAAALLAVAVALAWWVVTRRMTFSPPAA